MRPISINSDLTRMLDDYINWFNKKDFDLPMDEKRFGDRDMEYYCSKEYLDHVMSESKKHRGPPEYAKVCDFHLTHKTPQQAREKSLEFCKGLGCISWRQVYRSSRLLSRRWIYVVA